MICLNCGYDYQKCNCLPMGLTDGVYNEEDTTMTFKEELEILINKHSMENDSNTPDFILADYLMECLQNFNKTSRTRENGMGKSRRLYEGGSMKELTVREATNIIKKDMEAIYNPRILEQILNILGHEDKVFEKHKCCGSKDYNRHKCWCINGE